jgi:excinuclease UvrABC nuclease subunit
MAKKTKFADPYTFTKAGIAKSNVPALIASKNQSGVYVIRKKESHKVVYVGFSKNQLYKTVYRHFQTWTDISRTTQTRFTYPKKGYQVRIIFTTPARAQQMEKYLIQLFKPKDNELKYPDLFMTKEAIQKIEQEIIQAETIYDWDE